MKRLTIIRHAKSDWDDPNLRDHERPLNARGRTAAPAVGEALASRGYHPDLIISSTAVRAVTTARAIAEKIGYPSDSIREEGELYNASVRDLQGVVASIDDAAGIDHAMLFGHNPGMEDSLDHLIGAYANHRFVTCAVADLELDIEHWGEVSAGCGKLIEFFTPHDLA